LQDIRIQLQHPAYDYINLPEKKTLQDYDLALNKYIDTVEKIPGLKSIYQTAPELHPGITRLQLLLVLDNTASRRDITGLLEPLEDGDNELIDSRPFLVNEDIFRKINMLTCPLSLQYIHGENIPRDPLGEENQRYYAYLILMEQVLPPLIIYCLHSLVDAEFDTRKTLAWLERTRQALEYGELFIGEADDKWLSFSERVHSLCRNWFEMDLNRFQMMKDLMKDGLFVLYGLMDALAKAAEYRGMVNLIKRHESPLNRIDLIMPCPSGHQFLPKDEAYINIMFEEKWEARSALRRMICLYEQTGTTVILAPLHLGLQFVLYSQGVNKLNKMIQKYLRAPEGIGNLSIPRIVDDHARLIDEHIKFLADRGVPYGWEMTFDYGRRRALLKGLSDMVSLRLHRKKLAYDLATITS
jgi:hypothetical protein